MFGGNHKIFFISDSEYEVSKIIIPKENEITDKEVTGTTPTQLVSRKFDDPVTNDDSEFPHTFSSIKTVENEILHQALVEGVEELRHHVLATEITTKFAPKSHIQGIDITRELNDWDLGDFRIFHIQQNELLGWRDKVSNRIERIPTESITSDIGWLFNDYERNPKILHTLFMSLSTQALEEAQEIRFNYLHIYGAQPPRVDIKDSRAAYHPTPVTIGIKITSEGWRKLAKLLRENRMEAPRCVRLLLEMLYPGLIGEEITFGVLLPKTEKLVFIDESFDIQWSSEGYKYIQANPKRIFPSENN